VGCGILSDRWRGGLALKSLAGRPSLTTPAAVPPALPCHSSRFVLCSSTAQMATRFVLLAALLLAMAHGALGQVVLTVFSDSECTAEVPDSGMSWVTTLTLGQCADGYTMYVAEDGSAAYLASHFGQDCAKEWSFVKRYAAGDASCMPYIAYNGDLLFVRTTVPADRDASAVPPFDSWPPTGSAMAVSCTDDDCSTNCHEFSAQRLGLCDYNSRLTCSPDGLFSHELYYSGVPDGQCSTPLSYVYSHPANGPNKCSYYGSRQYLKCPVRAAGSSPAVTPSLVDMPILKTVSNSAADCTNRVVHEFYLYGNSTCTGYDSYTIADAAGSGGILLQEYDNQYCETTPTSSESIVIGACTSGKDYAHFTKGSMPKELAPLACALWGSCGTDSASSSSGDDSSSSSTGDGDEPSTGSFDGAAQHTAPTSGALMALAATLALALAQAA